MLLMYEDAVMEATTNIQTCVSLSSTQARYVAWLEAAKQWDGFETFFLDCALNEDRCRLFKIMRKYSMEKCGSCGML